MRPPMGSPIERTSDNLSEMQITLLGPTTQEQGEGLALQSLMATRPDKTLNPDWLMIILR